MGALVRRGVVLARLVVVLVIREEVVGVHGAAAVRSVDVQRSLSGLHSEQEEAGKHELSAQQPALARQIEFRTLQESLHPP